MKTKEIMQRLKNKNYVTVIKEYKRSDYEKNQCQNCDKWARFKREDILQGQGECTDEHFINAGTPYVKEGLPDALYYWNDDDESNNVCFSTGEQFGCIYFTRRK